MLRRGRTNTSLAALRPVCKHGTSCYRRNPEHVNGESHPADEDYLDCCEKEGIEPEFVSVRKLFAYCDAAGTGKVSKENLAKVWAVLQRLGTDIGSLEDIWEKLDDDGNGFINFSEFAEFTTRHNVGLPLGLDDVLARRCDGSDEAPALRCGVLGCDCRCFVMRKPRCKYGESCYQKNEEHRMNFIHPGDEGWEESASTTIRDKNMCRCGHKQKLHASPLSGFKAVTYPAYWSSDVTGETEFNVRIPARDLLTPFIQKLVDLTYSDVTTRDRVKSCGTWEVPQNYHVVSVIRNENSRLWRKYKIKRGELIREASSLMENASDDGSAVSRQASMTQPDFGDFSSVKTTRVWEQLFAEHAGQLGATSDDAPNKKVNEWVLFHGTSATAAEAICGHDFTMRLAGSSTGTLYGRGTYLAESITKADEYSKEEDGLFTVLLCRVLGGRVRYCDERTPDAEGLTAECTEGMYDCIIGDRIKTSGTYREFVVFDTENVYPEYIIKYKRGPFFKSPSHP